MLSNEIDRINNGGLLQRTRVRRRPDPEPEPEMSILPYYGDETDVSKIKQTMNETAVPPQIEPSSSQKPWYKFWGGKKTRKNRKFSRKHRKYSRRR